MLLVREDIGCHNADAKVIGWAFENDRIPLGGSVLRLIGRASFEARPEGGEARVPVLAAVSVLPRDSLATRLPGLQ
jgi:FdhD protein